MERQDLPEKYYDYIRLLQDSVGEEVHVRESFGIISSIKTLKGLKRIAEESGDLFPHSVLFLDGSEYNLADIEYIARIGGSKKIINPNYPGTLYFYDPEEKKPESGERGFNLDE